MHSSVSQIIQQQEFQQGLQLLNSKRRRMQAYLVLAAMLLLLCAIALYFNQQLIYAFFDIAPKVQQLHVPYSAQVIQQQMGGSATDYFFRLMYAVFWLVLKLMSSLIGASLLLYCMRKLPLIRNKIKGFIKQVLAWLIFAMCIWIGLGSLQTDSAHDKQQERWVSYNTSIYDSKLYQALQSSQLDQAIQDYLMLQTALLHRPADKEAAVFFAERLKKTELSHGQNFAQYGFSAGQLWTMQYQLYGQAVTPLAHSVQANVNRANFLVHLSRMCLLVMGVAATIVCLVCYLLKEQLSRRVERITHYLKGN